MLMVRVARCAQHLLCAARVSRIDDDLSGAGRIPGCPEADTDYALIVAGDTLTVEQLRHHLRLRLILCDRYGNLIWRCSRREKPHEESPQFSHSSYLSTDGFSKLTHYQLRGERPKQGSSPH